MVRVRDVDERVRSLTQALTEQLRDTKLRDDVVHVGSCGDDTGTWQAFHLHQNNILQNIEL